MFMNSHFGHPARRGILHGSGAMLRLSISRKVGYSLTNLAISYNILKFWKVNKCNGLKCRFRKLYSKKKSHQVTQILMIIIHTFHLLTLTSRMAPLEYNTRLGPVCIFDILKYSGIIKLAMTHCRRTTIE